MYLWKYWRETRIVFAVCIAGIALLFLILPGSNLAIQTNQQPSNALMIGLMVTLVFELFPVSFIAWLLGSYGVGRDLGEKTGSYIFTRPRSRAFFVWSDWAYGMTELLAIVVLLNTVLGLYVRRFLIASGDPGHGSYIQLYNQTVPVPYAVFLNSVAVFLLAGLVFGVTYFSTILLRHSRGLMLGAGALLGYLVLKPILQHYWPGLYMPELVAPSWIKTMVDSGLKGDFWLSLGLRGAVVVLFPFAAQLLLEKTDI